MKVMDEQIKRIVMSELVTDVRSQAVTSHDVLSIVAQRLSPVTSW